MDTFVNRIHRMFANQGMIRPDHGRVLGGVLAGTANALKADANAVRLVFVIALFAIPGSQFLIYPVLWLLMPSAQRAAEVLNTDAHVPAPAPAPTAEHAVAGHHPQAAYPQAAQYPAAGESELNLSK